jgi:hypothetical protein
VAEAQAQMREGQVLRVPITTMEAALAQEFMKGEAAGIRALLAIPTTFIEAHRDDDREGEADVE